MGEVEARSSSESGHAEAPTPSNPRARNLVICCDGTGNVWGNEQDTNVVRLVRACAKTPSQIVYYDPGVGTASEFPGIGWFEAFKVRIQRLIGLAFGGGIYTDIGSAYAFLIRNYREGDRIWVFGFSRGAFTARAVAGMVNLFGVVRPAGEVMIPVLLRIYFSDRSVEDKHMRNRQQLANDIRCNFADEPGSTARVYFTGVWDTVESVGGLRMIRISSSTSTVGKAFDHVRHAVAAAEYRAKYEPRLYPDPNRDEPGWVEILPDGGELEVGKVKPADDGTFEYRPGLKQLYFPGAHSDVGGSYDDRGLSDCSLKWMLDEGGVAEFARRNLAKAACVYAVIDRSGGFYRNEVVPAVRSRMNIPFFMADEALTARFVSESKAAGLLALKGHKALGGLRASLYNAMPVAGAQALADFMDDFQRRHG